MSTGSLPGSYGSYLVCEKELLMKKKWNPNNFSSYSVLVSRVVKNELMFRDQSPLAQVFLPQQQEPHQSPLARSFLPRQVSPPPSSPQAWA